MVHAIFCVFHRNPLEFIITDPDQDYDIPTTSHTSSENEVRPKSALKCGFVIIIIVIVEIVVKEFLLVEHLTKIQ